MYVNYKQYGWNFVVCCALSQIEDINEDSNISKDVILLFPKITEHVILLAVLKLNLK